MNDRILFTGDRKWTNVELVHLILSNLDRSTSIIHGAAKGLDSIVDQQAKLLGFLTIHSCPAAWEKYGRAAGPIRNRFMYTTYNPTMIMAFHDNIRASKGTRDMCMVGLKNNIPTYLVTSLNEIKLLTHTDLK